MKRSLRVLFAVLALLSLPALLCAGTATVYFGTVKSIDARKVTIVARNGAEKSFKISSSTRSIVSGRVTSSRVIRPNSRVQIAVDQNDACLQIAVEEVPR